jgi:type I restriction enzyme, S subunit
MLRVAQSSPFIEAVVASSTGVSYPAIATSTLGGIKIPLPDLATQQRIAAFLDRETARIDQLIAKKQRLVGLLTEKEQAVISNATCKGLNPTACFVESGVEWFGRVPEHWIVCRFNRLIASKVDYRGRTPEKTDDGVFLVTARNIRRGRIDYERSQEFTTHEEWLRIMERGVPQIGDVVLTTEAPLGEVANVDRPHAARGIGVSTTDR